MKKRNLKVAMILYVVALVVAVLPAASQNLYLGVEGGYFIPADDDLKNIYGSGGMTYGFNAGYQVMPNLAIHGAYDMFRADGDTTVSGADVKLKLDTMRLGVFYLFGQSNGFRPKVGAGVSFNSVKEETPFGNFDDSKTGFYGALGFDAPIAGNFLVGAEAVYNNAKLAGDFGNVEIGGISLLLSLKVRL